jgi:uncharacterized iron-regulated membrane protein
MSADFVRRALSGHAAIGLLAGALLYILCLSGSLVVVHEEWQRWEQPNIPEMTHMAPEAVQAGIARVLATEADRPPTTHLWVHLPNDALPRTVITTDHQAVYLDQAGNIVGPEAHAWTEFLIHMHYYFHLPVVFGLTVVGALGVMMAALALGGVLAHPRIFRDAFRLRAHGAPQLAYADWHNRLGVWTLPFNLAVSVTGALLGLATIMAMVMAAIFHDGDREHVFAPIFGHEPAADARSAPLPDIVAALRHMAAADRGVTPTYVILHDPGTRGQHVQVLADHPRRLIFGDYYLFDADGRFQGKVGMSDGSLGQQAAGSTYKLHFGSFGGLPVKLAYILFGLALTIISATGTWLWLMKRRQRGRAAPRLEAMWTTVIWATPMLMALAFLLRLTAGPEAPLAALFWIGLLICVLGAAFVKDGAKASIWLRSGLGVSLIGVGVVHLTVLEPSGPAVILIDALLILVGAALMVRRWRGMRALRREFPAAPQPAE